MTAGRADRKDITQEIALAIPRESPSCLKTKSTVSHRHEDITSYFSDEDDDSSPSEGKEVVQETKNDEDQGSEEDVQEDELPLDSFFLPPLSDSKFFLRHKETGYLKSPPIEAS